MVNQVSETVYRNDIEQAGDHSLQPSQTRPLFDSARSSLSPLTPSGYGSTIVSLHKKIR